MQSKGKVLQVVRMNLFSICTARFHASFLKSYILGHNYIHKYGSHTITIDLYILIVYLPYIQVQHLIKDVSPSHIFVRVV